MREGSLEEVRLEEGGGRGGEGDLRHCIQHGLHLFVGRGAPGLGGMGATLGS